MNPVGSIRDDSGGVRWPALDAALEASVQPRLFFVRDDDAGWADDRLLALLDTMQQAQVPIDLAVIPAALGDALAGVLCERIDAAPGLLGVHQHGHAHVNHEPQGRRKGEFGATRPLDARALDVATGRARLQRCFGARLDAFFTPPWNRCADDLPMLLASMGFAALSRDTGAPAQQALPELPVHVDWCRHWREAQGDAVRAVAAIDAALAQAVRAPEAAVGLMLHHAVMGDDELALLRVLLQRLGRHRKCRWRPMRECLAPPSLAAQAA